MANGQQLAKLSNCIFGAYKGKSRKNNLATKVNSSRGVNLSSLKSINRFLMTYIEEGYIFIGRMSYKKGSRNKEIID